MLEKRSFRRTYVVVPIAPGVVAMVLKSENGVEVVEMFEDDGVLADMVAKARRAGWEPRYTA